MIREFGNRQNWNAQDGARRVSCLRHSRGRAAGPWNSISGARAAARAVLQPALKVTVPPEAGTTFRDGRRLWDKHLEFKCFSLCSIELHGIRIFSRYSNLERKNLRSTGFFGELSRTGYSLDWTVPYSNFFPVFKFLYRIQICDERDQVSR